MDAHCGVVTAESYATTQGGFPSSLQPAPNPCLCQGIGRLAQMSSRVYRMGVIVRAKEGV